jgi:cytochrome c peroxidase
LWKFPSWYFMGMRFLVCSVLLFTGCMTGTTPSDDPPGPPLVEDGDWVPTVPVLPPDWPAVVSPASNPYTPAKAVLGRRLFREPMLGRDGTSCQWCHDPVSAFTFKHGGLGSTVGLTPTLRGPPSLLNAAFASSLMSDGSAGSLEEQAMFPLLAENEMNMTAPEIEARLSNDTTYVRMFRQTFGPGPIRIGNVVKALAAYQRTLISYRSDYDRWKAGDEGALSPEAKQGVALFFGKADCARCHTPPVFSDGLFHNTGLDSLPVDAGRMRVTGLAADAGRVRTPTLRNLAITAPYMHDGRFVILEEVIRHYNEGGHGTNDIAPLGLTDREQYELAEFLRSLLDPAIFQYPGY